MSQLSDRIKEQNRRITERDPELAHEIDETRRELRETPPRTMAHIRAEPRTPTGALEGAAPPPPDRGELIAETIVRRKLRPVLAIKKGTADLVLNPADSQAWKTRLTRAKPVLIPAIRAVGRVEVRNHPDFSWIGTAWLVAEDIVVTNRHVAREFARRKGEQFVFLQTMGPTMEAWIDFLEEFDNTASLEFGFEQVLHIEDDEGPDMAFIRVRSDGARTLASPIELATGAAKDGDQVAVIGYPAADSRIPEPDLMREIFGDHYDKKRLAPGELMKIEASVVQHDCSTLGGNSGSAVVSLDTGKAVGLHFAGRFLEANFAVSGSAIAQRLEQVRRGRVPRQSGEAPTSVTSTDRAATQATSDDRAVTVTIPLRVTVQLGAPDTSGARTVMRVAQPAAGDDASEDVEELEEGRPEDYEDREGYLADFLGDDKVPLPTVNTDKDDVLTYTLHGNMHTVLPYEHFSVLMSESRRMCRYSAVNIDGRLSKRMKRPGWRTDPRIPKEAQINQGECYGNPPKFARGHMTRREDPIWGKPTVAERGNSDSMHVTNTVPQMQPFNAGIWLGLENYALENAREDDMKICVFTGPFLRDDDPERYGVRVPIEFWKVIAFIHDDTGKLCATGYSMSQKNFLQEEEFVFGQHETTQLPIRTIEARSGLSFGRLADLDPLRDVQEARVAPLTRFEQIRFV